MNNIIKKTKKLLFLEQKSIFASALIIGSMIVISRMFGFVRYRVLATMFNKAQLDIYFASFRIPDIIFEILISGALTASFIPIYIKYKKGDDFYNKLSSIINLLIITLGLAILVSFIFMGQIVKIITPGFNSQQEALVVYYSRILLLGQLPFLIAGNIVTGIAQANKIFFISAISPIFYNLSIIIFTIALAPSIGLLAPIIGVVIGALLFLTIQIPVIKITEFRFKKVLQKSKALIEFIRMVIPRTFTIIVSQIDATVDLSLTTLISTGAYTEFYFAQRLQLLPVSILGMAFGQASLPYLSQMYHEKRIEDLKKVVVNSILNIFFFIIPTSAILIFARTPIVRLFFGGQKFDWDATVKTAVILSYFAISIPMHSIYYFIVRIFYASLDSKTPFYVSLISTTINTVLSLFFVLVLHLQAWSLGLSFTITITFNTLLLLIILIKRLKGLDIKRLVLETLKITLSAFISSIGAYYLMKFLDGIVLNLTNTINVIILLAVTSFVYFSIYIFLAWLVQIEELYLIFKLISKAKTLKQKVIELYLPVE